jgi:hypothetical protein
MMVKEFCDRCGKDVTGKTTGAVSGVPDADRDGNGTATDAADILCQRCYRAIWTFIQQTTAATKDDVGAGSRATAKARHDERRKPRPTVPPNREHTG